MSGGGRSYRDILRSTVMIGGSTAAKVAIGVVRVKVLAVLVGPAGVGLMGIYTNLVSTTSVFAGLGVASSGVRQIAGAEAGQARTVRLTLMGYNVLAGLIAGLVVALLRTPLSVYLTDTADHAWAIGWLGLAVLLTLFSGSQAAVLQGQRRIRELATVNIVGAVAGAIAGVASVVVWREDGILLFTLTAPAAAALAGFAYNQTGDEVRTPFDVDVGRKQAWEMIRIGVPFMGAALVTNAAQLATRTLIVQQLGLEASGQFQAAWTIAATYIGFIFGAMGADYYPRLVAAISNHEEASRLVDEQTEVALLLGAPVLLAMSALAPVVLTLMYSSSFTSASDMLRLLVLGDAVRLLNWPMGFVLVAKGRGALFFGTQLAWNLAYLALLAVTLPTFGVVAAGGAFAAASLVVFVLNQIVAGRLIGYRLGRRNLLIGGGLFVSCCTVSATGLEFPWVAMGLGSVLSIVTMAGSYQQIRRALRK